MHSTGEREKRRRDRTKAVLPVRVRGIDASGARFEDLAHTLDITPTGARLGAIRHALRVADRITITFRQRRIDFQVVWTRQIANTGEYQVGAKAVVQDADAWGLSSSSESQISARQRQAALAGALA